MMQGLYPMGDALQKAANCAEQMTIRRPSVLENLQNQRQQLALRLADVDAAITALEANPGAADVMEALAKVNGY